MVSDTATATRHFESYFSQLSSGQLDEFLNTIETAPAQWSSLFAENEKLRAAIFLRAAQSPLLRRHLIASRGMNGRGQALSESWMALAERDSMALTLAATPSPWTMSGVKPGLLPLLTAFLAGQYLEAHTYLWSSAILQAIAACPLPPHVLSLGLAPYPTTYHAFENASVVTNSDDPAQYLADGFLLTPSLHGSLVWLPCSAKKPQGVSTEIATWDLRYGQRYPEDFSAEKQAGLYLPLAMLAMLQTHTTVVTDTKLPRGFRRHADFSATDAAQTVSVVRLRHDAEHAVHAYNAESVAWRHKWWVSGHFRAQWMPRTRSHRPTWIAPYLKGDPALPILDHVYTVDK